MLRDRQARLAQASESAERGDTETAGRIVESVLAEDPNYGPALALLGRLGGQKDSWDPASGRFDRHPPEGAAHDSRPATTSGDAAATLPGTNVSAGSWAQFQRRMQLRRETTCLAALRRAMDGGDYPAALERARELSEIDSSWDDVRLFLEDLQAHVGGNARRAQEAKEHAAIADAVSSQPAPVGAPPVPTQHTGPSFTERPPEATTAKRSARPPSVNHPPAMAATTVAVAAPPVPGTRGEPRPRRGRMFAAAILLVLLATLAGWVIARMLPDEIVAGWAGALGLQSPTPTARTQAAESDKPADTLAVPPANVTPLPLPFPDDGMKGNASSQNRNESGSTTAQPPLTDSAGGTIAAAGTGGTADAPRSPSPRGTQTVVPPAPSPHFAAPPPSGVAQPLTPPSTAVQASAPAARDQRQGTGGGADANHAGSAPAGPPPTPSAVANSRPADPIQSTQSAAAPTSTASGAPPTVAAPPDRPATPPPPQMSAEPVSTLPSSPSSSTSSSQQGSSSSVVDRPPASRPPATGNSASAPPDHAEAGSAAGTSAAGSGSAASPRASAGETERDSDERAIVLVLGSYAQGYTGLNAAAVRRVWPTVNEEALKNAFEQLQVQQVSFASCTVDVRGLHASATCRGTARYVPRVGNRESISASHVWQFALRKVVDAWVIESAAIK